MNCKLPILLALLSLFQFTSRVLAADADTIRLVGQPVPPTGFLKTGIIAANFRLYTGSSAIFPVLDESGGLNPKFDILLENFINRMVGEGEDPPPKVAAGGLCELKNVGDRNCDGQVDNEDLAAYAADLGPLVLQDVRPDPTGPANIGGFSFRTLYGQYLYVAAWGQKGVQLSSLTDIAGPSQTPIFNTGPSTNASEKARWAACTTGITVAGDPSSFVPSRSVLIDEISKCQFDLSQTESGTISLPEPELTTATAGGVANSSLWASENIADRLIVLRRRLNSGSKQLKLTAVDDGNIITVTVDPADVVAFSLSLEFDADQVSYLDNSEIGVAPYNLVPNPVVQEGNILSGIAGSTAIDGARFGPAGVPFTPDATAEVLPLEMDLFRVQFLKNGPDACRNVACDFRVFAGDGDYLQVVSDEGQVPIIDPDFTTAQIAEATLPFVAVPRVEASFPNGGGPITIVPLLGPIDAAGLVFDSDNDGLVPVPTGDPSPFSELVVNDPIQVFFDGVGQIVTIDGPLTLSVGANAGASITGAVLFPAGDSISFNVTELAAAAIVGDANGDGTVNFADFVALSVEFGQAAGPNTTSDFDGDGVVAFSDFLILARNFNQGAVGTVEATNIPEPSGMCLFGIGMLLLGRARRRPNRQ